MTAAEALEAARAAGVREFASRCRVGAPEAVLDELKRHKAAILTLIRSDGSVWSREDWQAFFDERAAILEFVGGLSQIDAEAQALESCIFEWMNQNPEPTDPEGCAWCSGPEMPGTAVVHLGMVGHTWLHSCCWDAWYEERRGRALEHLAALGIAIPDYPTPNLPDDLGKSGAGSWVA
jgi:hypothetical protein